MNGEGEMGRASRRTKTKVHAQNGELNAVDACVVGTLDGQRHLDQDEHVVNCQGGNCVADSVVLHDDNFDEIPAGEELVVRQAG